MTTEDNAMLLANNDLVEELTAIEKLEKGLLQYKLSYANPQGLLEVGPTDNGKLTTGDQVLRSYDCVSDRTRLCQRRKLSRR